MKKAVKSGSVLLLANLAEVAFPFIRNILLARLLSQENFGVAVSLAMIVALVEIGFDFGIPVSAVRYTATDDPRKALATLHTLQLTRAVMVGALIMAIHRTTQLQLPLVLVGAGLPQLPGLAGNAKSYAERLFTFPQIGPLARDEGRLAVTRPAEAQGVRVEPAAVDAILDHTHGYPYFLQEWAYETWNVTAGDSIQLGDVERAAPRVIEKLDTNFFRVRFDRLTPTEKKYLRAMAELGPGPHRSGEIAREYGAKVESVGPMRSALIKKGMIYSPSHGDTAFTVPLFDEFLARAIPKA